MSVEGSVRDRRRAETVAEIKAAALEQLATAGTGGLSLRGVARAVGMTVQSLYHYFDSRDALLSALVTDSHNALADAAEAAAAATRDTSASASAGCRGSDRSSRPTRVAIGQGGAWVPRSRCCSSTAAANAGWSGRATG